LISQQCWLLDIIQLPWPGHEFIAENKGTSNFPLVATTCSYRMILQGPGDRLM